jgi:predicted anti-sigma-YlaC factor YlaD
MRRGLSSAVRAAVRAAMMPAVLSMPRSAACLAAVVASPAWAYTAPGYTYVRMSLTVPWTLYFVFLACVLIPFVVMIALAWRGASKPDAAPKDAASVDAAGDAT